MKRASALASLSELARLGLPPKAVLPTLLSVLRDLIPFEHTAFLWLDEDSNLVDLHQSFDEPLAPARRYIDIYLNQAEARWFPTHRWLQKSKATVEPRIPAAMLAPYFGSPFFDEVARQLRVRHFLRAAFREGERPIGNLMLLTSLSNKAFGRSDHRALQDAYKFIAHALAKRSQEEDVDGDAPDEAGFVIVEADGRIQSLTPSGRRLLHWAADEPLTGVTMSDTCLAWSRPLIKRLLVKLRDPHATALVTVRNRRGTFALRAYALQPAEQAACTPVCVQIVRSVPLELKLLAQPRVRTLPPREKQIALLLAKGLSNTAIANALGVRPNTVVSNIRSIYGRYGVEHRAQLVKALCAGDHAAAA
jgi:DNA-binding CsgD family transcriptional regulator